MISLPELLKLKYPNANFMSDIKLQDIGKGPAIYEWNLVDPVPRQKDLDMWQVEFDLAYRQHQAVLQRKYPPVTEQLDMIYKDKINNTNIWVDTITDIKLANPKPEA